jgi:hypothetical protein
MMEGANVKYSNTPLPCLCNRTVFDVNANKRDM